MLVRSFLSAGVDTTVYGLGNALYCFAKYPRAMDDPARKSRADPCSPSRRCCASRRRCRPSSAPRPGTSMSAASSSAKARRCCCFSPPPTAIRAAGSRPDEFDVKRRATGHMTFGTGIHGCVGQAVARLEAEAVFGALARRVASFEMTAEPSGGSTTRCAGSTPCRFASCRPDAMTQGSSDRRRRPCGLSGRGLLAPARLQGSRLPHQ